MDKRAQGEILAAAGAIYNNELNCRDADAQMRVELKEAAVDITTWVRQEVRIRQKCRKRMKVLQDRMPELIAALISAHDMPDS